MDNLITEARRYIENGWSVFPIKKGSKVPAVPQWGMYREQHPDSLTLQQWFASAENNIAIVTGKLSGLVVIDIDAPEKVTPFLEKYPTDLVQRTPSGGAHLFYHYADGDIGNSVSKIDGEIDVRGEGGYVVVAPSYINGAEYPSPVYYQWERKGSPAELPGPLRDRIIAAKPKQDIQQAQTDEADALWVKVLTHGFTEGRHNEELKDCARYLFRRGLTEQVIIDTLTVINSKDATPQTPSEMLATIRSGINYEKQRLDLKRKEQEQEQDTPTQPFTVHTMLDVMSEYDNYDVQWLIQDWLPEKSILLLAAPPEHFKTWLLLDAAVSVANGIPFANGVEAVQGPVIIIQQEDYIGLVIQRIRTLIKAKVRDREFPFMRIQQEGSTIISLQNPFLAPIHVHTDALFSFDNPDSMDGLERVIEETGAKLVVVDPLYMLSNASDYFASAAREIKRIKQIRDKTGATFLFAHHNRKSGGEGRSQIWGSQLLNGAFEGAWVMYPSDGQLMIERSGKFFTKKSREQITFEIDTTFDEEKYVVTVEAASGLLAGGKHEQAIYDLLSEEGPMRAAHIARALSITRDSAGKTLTKMVEAGSIGKTTDKKQVIYHLLPEDNEEMF